MKFILDSMFGKLAGYLRMLGYDSIYIESENRLELKNPATLAGRTLVTKDRKSKFDAASIIYLSEISPLKQLSILKDELKLTAENSFTLCIECNHPLSAIKKHSVSGKVPQRVFENYDEFNLCPQCGRVYWKGTHYEAMVEKMKKTGL